MLIGVSKYSTNASKKISLLLVSQLKLGDANERVLKIKY